MKIWHYTTLAAMEKILQADKIKRGPELGRHEIPGVWCSTNPEWDHGANRPAGDPLTVRGSLSRDALFERGRTPARVQINARRVKLIPWERHCRNIPLHLALAHERAGQDEGADLREWFVSYKDVPLEACVLPVETWNGREWIPRPDLSQAVREEGRALTDLSTWRMIEPPRGAALGGVYRAPNGGKYYVKQYSDPDQARSELAANCLYRLLGANVPEVRLQEHRGNLLIISKWIEDLVKCLPGSAPNVEILRAYFAACLTGNRDCVGGSLDNLMVHEGTRHCYTIDTGGAFRFGGNGRPKEFLPVPHEVRALLSPLVNPAASSVFGPAVRDARSRQRALELLEALTGKAVLEAFLVAGFPADEAEVLAAITWARRQFIVEHERAAGPPRGDRSPGR